MSYKGTSTLYKVSTGSNYSTFFPRFTFYFKVPGTGALIALSFPERVRTQRNHVIPTSPNNLYSIGCVPAD